MGCVLDPGGPGARVGVEGEAVAGPDLAEKQPSGLRYAYSISQAEYSRNLIFASGARDATAYVAPQHAGCTGQVERVTTVFSA